MCVTVLPSSSFISVIFSLEQNLCYIVWTSFEFNFAMFSRFIRLEEVMLRLLGRSFQNLRYEPLNTQMSVCIPLYDLLRVGNKGRYKRGPYMELPSSMSRGNNSFIICIINPHMIQVPLRPGQNKSEVLNRDFTYHMSFGWRMILIRSAYVLRFDLYHPLNTFVYNKRKNLSLNIDYESARIYLCTKA